MKAALASAVAACLVATMQADAPEWSAARSPRFEVFSTGSPDRAAKALEMFEDVHAFFTSYLSLPAPTRLPTRVLIFSTDAEYAPYRVNESADAFYQPSRERDYIVMKSFGRDAFRIVAHEYAHAALGLKGADLPPWLGEGLAEFFSSVELRGQSARLGLVPDGRVQALRKGNRMSVPQLLDVRRDSREYNERDHAGMFYAESWALTHMLYTDRRYRGGSARLLGLFQQGKTSAEAFADAYGKTPVEIDKDFRAYLRNERYGSFTVEAPRAARQAVTPSPVPAFDAALVVADMLSSEIGKDAETRTMLDALAREQPDHVTLLELRAFFELRTLGGAAARPSFQRAVDRGSQNPLVLAQFALLIASQDPSRASDFLRRAVALAPANDEIRIHAATLLVATCKPSDALSMIAAVAHVPSDLQFQYYQAEANSHLMLGNAEAAAAAVARLAAVARTPEEKDAAARLRAEETPAIGRVKAANCSGHP